ncbi:uncharacterized protein B0P05DRAFT_489418 [Gilbertella persicaria]|uniref:Uncharacterized protein n=1 Tax=Rhizopus stolonifer TaxID=4846 RepID=A0A367JU12_RHIST|nr:uncharacterized protein B0P05DRAFT_489418 [Gilbertella persicaria]KAI8082612.1 hypothetical protein B0P05DRAFT_489418 [Gilbertella persicaria]RCH93339.1 hypothetical protein CU098_008580 [Rhizopus stolonifer]
MPNPSIPSDVVPAQVVGGMRVKQPNHHNHMHAMKNEDKTKEEEHEQEQENSEEQERMRLRILQERQAQDMQNHTASRQHDVSKNAGNHVKQQFNTGIQPRSMNH